MVPGISFSVSEFLRKKGTYILLSLIVEIIETPLSLCQRFSFIFYGIGLRSPAMIHIFSIFSEQQLP